MAHAFCTSKILDCSKTHRQSWKKIPEVGRFAVMATAHIVLGLEYSFLKTDIDLFIMVFGVSYLFGNIGPNTTTIFLFNLRTRSIA